MKKGKKDKKDVVVKKDSKKEPDKKSKLLKKKKTESTPDVNLPKKPLDGNLKEAFVELALLYQSFQDTPKLYGGTIPLYFSEINALEVIGTHPGLNLTAIATALNISKSAVSKCTGKLIDKGLITKERSTINIREVIFNLTGEGQQLFNAIIPYEQSICSEVNKTFDGLSNDEKCVLAKFSSDLKNALSITLKRLNDH